MFIARKSPVAGQRRCLADTACGLHRKKLSRTFQNTGHHLVNLPGFGQEPRKWKIEHDARPTAHRILNQLIHEGLVEQRQEPTRYLIGEQISMLALARPVKSPILAAAEGELDRLREAIGDTLFLTVCTNLDTLCIARRVGLSHSGAFN
jgi:hypothetical protein